MAFPKNLLADHEKLIFDLRPHWIAVVPSALWTLLSLVAVFLSYRYLDGTAATIGAAVVAVAWIALALVPFLRWRFTMFVLTTDRLITREGVLAKHSKEIPLERINDVSFSQSVLERMLGAGDLMVESAGERGQNRIANVRKPEQVQLMIAKETETNNNRMMRPDTPAPVAREASVTDQIEALARLKEQGAISELEFETKKQELLKRM